MAVLLSTVIVFGTKEALWMSKIKISKSPVIPVIAFVDLLLLSGSETIEGGCGGGEKEKRKTLAYRTKCARVGWCSEVVLPGFSGSSS